MTYKSITTVFILLLSFKLSARHINLGVYGGANFFALSADLKDYYNTPKAKVTPSYGAKLLLDIYRFQFGVGFNNITLKYYQPPQTINEYPFLQGDYNGISTFMKFNTYQFIANYKLGKGASYFYTGINLSYYIIQDNEIEPTSRAMATLSLSSRATLEEDGTFYGLQVGYNLHLTGGVSIQLETGARYMPLRIRGYRMTPTPPYYPYPILTTYEKRTIFDFPFSFGVNYNF